MANMPKVETATQYTQNNIQTNNNSVQEPKSNSIFDKSGNEILEGVTSTISDIGNIAIKCISKTYNDALDAYTFNIKM